jgi:16S rRNA (uracil1498-N3)-methyltransferase
VRIFVTTLAAGELVVRGDEHHYVAHVRRARVGEAIEVVDGAGRTARAEIVRITDAETVLAVGEPVAVVARPPLIRALVPLIKGDRMDACLEKLVEVGVDVIIVWPAARCVVRLDEPRRAGRLAHYQAAAQAAARQSGRAVVPTVTWSDLGAAVAGLPETLRLVLDPGADQQLDPGTAPDVTVISGPEGGLDSAERDTLARAGFTSIGLGPRVLRAETAPVIAVALIRTATRS